jgi:hypothetical protein
VELLAIGYKYNSRKVLCFVCTKDAGPTTSGVAYQAKWTDEYGNVRARPVERPEVISRYFYYSDVVDSHNHARQALLGLEKKWATQNCWFRLDCTFIGVTLTDAWKAFKLGSSARNKLEKEISIIDFTERVVWDCLNNRFDDSNQGDGGEDGHEHGTISDRLSPMVDLKRPPCEDESTGRKKPRRIDMSDDPGSVAESLSSVVGIDIQATKAGVLSPLSKDSVTHSKWKSPVLPGEDRAKRRHCRLCKRLTTMKCIQCNKSFCDDESGAGSSSLRFCWTKHTTNHAT